MTLAERLMERGMEKGIKKGMEQGIKRGMEQGMEKGMEQGRKVEKQELAKNLLIDGIEIELVAKYTKLSKDEVEKIRDEMYI